ncbi:MAG: hypothetical protein VX730_06870 [Pseudomonadota bacterium]|nr:hypothetical protein [Pseudomonadota bacterium]
MKIVPFHTSSAMFWALSEVRSFEAEHGRHARIVLTNVELETEDDLASQPRVPDIDFILNAGNPEVMIEACRVMKYAAMVHPEYKLLMKRRHGSELACARQLEEMPSADIDMFVTRFK